MRSNKGDKQKGAMKKGTLNCVPFLLRPISAVADAGGEYRARTCDPLLVRQVLSQLSYAPKTTQTGLEPVTFGVTGRRTNQLYH